MKYKYSVDSNNQLLIKPQKKKPAIPVRGSFSVDKNNRLIYWLNEPERWRRLYNLSPKVSFMGNWQLNSNYDLQLNFQENNGRHDSGSFILKGEVISTDRDFLVFEVVSKNRRGISHIYILKLSGSWQADEFNRLVFIVKKKASPDVITLENAWQINKNQQISYTYEKALLKRKTKVSRILTFEGFWEINSNNRLTYILSHSRQSRFNFRVQIESPNLYPKEGSIKYRIGIGLRQDKPSQMKAICLYGEWRFSRRAGFLFRVDYGRERFKDIEFGAHLYLSKKDKILFSLTDKKKKPLGLDITVTHSFLKKSDAQTFVKLKDLLNKREAVVEAGMRIPF